MANKRLNLTEIKPADSFAGFCMYIGPTIVGLIQNGTVYQGSKQQVIASPELAPVVAKYPLAADLLVDGEKLAEARAKLKRRDNLLSGKYARLVKLAAGKYGRID